MPTKIEWCTETWNPITGCTKCSLGCQNCYAERMAKRLKGMGLPQYQTVVDENGWTGKIGVVSLEAWHKPLHWKKPRLIFVGSMGDVFHPNVDAGLVHEILCIADFAPQHTFIICTKRPERIVSSLYGALCRWYLGGGDYLPNVWFMTTAENQEMADKRIPELLKIREASPGWPVLAVSLEPMLGSIDLTKIGGDNFGWGSIHSLAGYMRMAAHALDYGSEWETKRTNKIDWVIVGAETGKNKRPCKLEWVRSIRDQCLETRTPLFVKQLNIGGKIIKDMNLFPPDLQIRQYPEVKC